MFCITEDPEGFFFHTSLRLTTNKVNKYKCIHLDQKTAFQDEFNMQFCLFSASVTLKLGKTPDLDLLP